MSEKVFLVEGPNPATIPYYQQFHPELWTLIYSEHVTRVEMPRDKYNQRVAEAFRRGVRVGKEGK